VLAYLIGPIHAVRAQSAQLVLPGDNPDVASLILQHENGALSTLNASYASASEYYLMNVYGKDMTAFYDLHNGLRLLKRGESQPVAVPCASTIRWSRSSRSLPRRRAGRASTKSGARRRRDRSPWYAPAFSRRARDVRSRSRKY
jgi:predicted dehydrogenase